MTNIILLTRSTSSSEKIYIQEREHRVLIYLSQQCRVEVAVRTLESAVSVHSQSCSQCRLPKLQSVLGRSCRVIIVGVIGIWKCLLKCQGWSPTMFLFANYIHCILWQAIYEEAFTVTSGNFTEHILVKCPKKETFFDGQKKCWRIQYWTLSYRWTNWVWEIIGWSLRLQESYRPF